MSIRRAAVALIAALTVSALPATAQQPAVQPDSARAELRTVLRAFYFNLERHDWEALAAYILSPKLLESRSAPKAPVAPSKVAADSTRPTDAASAANDPPGCSTVVASPVDRALITLYGDWAEVSVPRCAAAPVGADKFSLIRFEQRWRFIYIDLFPEPGAVQLATPAR